VLPHRAEEAPRRIVYRTPTAQANLLETNSLTVFMPSTSGKVESALYDSSRMRVSGGRVLPAFHEGIDIAPLERDRAGRALDPVVSVAPGVVAHISRHSGNSNYGIYVVVRHSDEVGEIYTLYAHLASVRTGLAVGREVAAGDVLGILGNTPSSTIPVARSHVHFEVGTILNRRFPEWFRTLKTQPDHGAYHGWNLAGIDPVAVYRAQARTGGFSMKEYLLAEPAAFTLLVNGRGPTDYFRRYPALWSSGMPVENAKACAIRVSVGGVPLRGRPATAEETTGMGRDPIRISEVDEKVLGRNSRRLIVRASTPGGWKLSAAGEQWLDILQYPSVRGSRRGRILSEEE
jgi:murein DD-endopeptidase MepM/ murein hydrolase activator NlpD